MASNSKRNTPRAPVEIRVEYQRLNSFIADYTRDISRGGLFIKTETPSALGEQCYLTLTFPKLDEPITLAATVQHFVQPDEGPEPGMGLKFTFGDIEEKRALSRVVDHLMIEHLGVELYERLSGLAKQEHTSSMQAFDSSVDER
jgi:type IV pilus assembly protein PilZ